MCVCPSPLSLTLAWAPSFLSPSPPQQQQHDQGDGGNLLSSAAPAPLQRVLLPVRDLALLHEMRAGVQRAYRELQAADAASDAVAQVCRDPRGGSLVAINPGPQLHPVPQI